MGAGSGGAQASDRPLSQAVSREWSRARKSEIHAQMRDLNFGKPFIVHCDASQDGLGAALYQKQEGKVRIISLA